MFGIRKQVLGKNPDAHIRSTAGIICIDSKFPLDHYRDMLHADGEEHRSSSKKQFLRDVTGHLDKIAKNYVCPEDGSARFAFAFIPAESVYYFLVNEAYDMLQDYTAQGVQVVSPLTLSHKVALIKAGVHAKKLSEEANEVRDDIARLSKRFRDIDDKWSTLYGTHLNYAMGKAEEVDRAYGNLRDEFDRISRLPGERVSADEPPGEQPPDD